MEGQDLKYLGADSAGLRIVVVALSSTINRRILTVFIPSKLTGRDQPASKVLCKSYIWRNNNLLSVAYWLRLDL